MTLTNDQVDALLEALRHTHDHELACDEWLAVLPEFLEALPDEKASEGYRLVREHLELCPECREEMTLILTALQRKDAS